MDVPQANSVVSSTNLEPHFKEIKISDKEEKAKQNGFNLTLNPSP
jgi:hypothetical protein